MAAVRRGSPWPESALKGAAGPTQEVCAPGDPSCSRPLQAAAPIGARNKMENDQTLWALPPDTLSQGRWIICLGW